jgi:hypothetical protein
MHERSGRTSWAKGAAGEVKVGGRLDRLVAKDCIVLHDRQIPGSRANIDHLVIGRPGVFVINAKRYTGRVAKHRGRLHVGGRDRTPLVESVQREAATVREHLERRYVGAPVVPVLCFADRREGLLDAPFTIGDVEVIWPRVVGLLLRRRAWLDPSEINGIAAHLAEALPVAVG